MYDQRPPDSYSSPYGPGMEEESIPQKIGYFWEDHGKKIIALIVLLVAAYFAYDFFVGSFHTVGFTVKNAEGQAIGDAQLTVTKTGETKATYAGSLKSLSLKAGDYSVSVSADGYRDKTADCTFEKEDDGCIITLDKTLVTKITSPEFPPELYLGQTALGSLTLQNTGSKSEAIELAFEGDFKDLISKGFQLSTDPSSITVAGGQTLQVQLNITVPSTIVLKNKQAGDDKKGKIRLKYVSGNGTEIPFKLLPEPTISLRFAPATGTIIAGATNAPVGKITIQNNGTIAASNIQLLVELDPSSTANADWFTFDTSQISELTSKAKQEIQLYISPPLNANPVIISGQSHIIAQGETWQQQALLNIIIQGAAVSLNVSHTATGTIQLRKTGTDYPWVTGKKVTVTNNGTVTIPEIEVSAPAECTDNWVFFTQSQQITNLEPKKSKEIYFKITAPADTEANWNQTCLLRYTYTNPLTNQIVPPTDITPPIELKTS